MTKHDKKVMAAGFGLGISVAAILIYLINFVF